MDFKKKHLSSLKNNAQRGDEISNSVNVFKEKNNGLRKIYSHNYLIHRSSNSVVYICSYMFSPAHLIWNVCNNSLQNFKFREKSNIYSLKKNPQKPQNHSTVNVKYGNWSAEHPGYDSMTQL